LHRSKYFVDISKLFFGAGIVKQMVTNQYNIKELIFGLMASLVLLIIGNYSDIVILSTFVAA